MNSSFEYLMIGELCKQDRTIANSDNYLPVLSLDQIESNTGGIRYENSSKAASGDGTYFVYDEGHVLYCKLRPYLNKVALADHAGRCTTELVPLKQRQCTLSSISFEKPDYCERCYCICYGCKNASY